MKARSACANQQRHWPYPRRPQQGNRQAALSPGIRCAQARWQNEATDEGVRGVGKRHCKQGSLPTDLVFCFARNFLPNDTRPKGCSEPRWLRAIVSSERESNLVPRNGSLVVQRLGRVGGAFKFLQAPNAGPSFHPALIRENLPRVAPNFRRIETCGLLIMRAPFST